MKTFLHSFLISLISFITVDAAAQYCEASGPACGTANKRSILRFGITYQGNGLLNNGSGCDSYGDFTSQGPIKVVKGNSYEVFSQHSPFGVDQATVYIDFNKDNEFDGLTEAFEMAGTGGLHSGAFLVPVDAVSGLTRLRVVVNSGSTPSCGPAAFGEVEDYTILIGDGTDQLDEYCTSAGQACTDPGAPPRHIETFTIYDATKASIYSKESGCALTGYSNYTADVINLTAGESYTGELFVSGFNPQDVAAIMIDFDGDKSFVQVNEYFKQPGSGGIFTGAITIPTDAPSGLTRMRVVYKWGGGGSPSAAGCGKNNIGETEDYTVNIINPDAPSNEAPTATNDNAKVNQDAFVDIDVKANDADSDGSLDPTTVTITANPANGSTSVDGTTGIVTYTPNAGFNGSDNFKYTIKDDAGDASNEATVNVIVNGRPIATEDNANTFTEESVNIAVLNNDNDDSKIDTPSLAISTQALNGTATLKGDGTIDYVSNASFVGSDSFYYSICDTATPALCDTGLVIVAVAEVGSTNESPTALDDELVMDEDETKSVNVLENDTDPEDNLNPSSIQIITNPKNGLAEINPDFSIQYTPNPDYFGLDSLVYKVCDDETPALCDNAVLRITVNDIAEPNTPPTAVRDNANTQTEVLVNVKVLKNDVDPEGIDTTTLDVVSAPSNGTAAVLIDGTIDYTSNAAFVGKDTFEYAICGKGTPLQCDSAIVVVTVSEVGNNNQPPVVVNDTVELDEDTDIDIYVLSNDSDPEDGLDSNSIEIVVAATNGVLNFNSDYSINYKPNDNYFGMDSFTYYVCDNETPELCDQAKVIITVLNVVDAPIAIDDEVTTGKNTDVVIDFSANDNVSDGEIDNDLTQITVEPTNGTTTFNNAKTLITYSPNPGFWGYDTMYYSICNTEVPAGCDTAMIKIYVDDWSSVNQNLLLDLTLFPNPVIGEINLSATTPFEGVFSISDISGKIILNTKLTIPGAINLDNLKPGVYLISVEEPRTQKTYRSKIIKN